MKKILIAGFILVVVPFTLWGNRKYIEARNINSQAFPAHVELTWRSPAGFLFDIYRSSDAGRNYVHCGSSDTGYFTDFVGKPETYPSWLLYKIIPQSVKLKTVRNKTNVISVSLPQSTDSLLLDMTERYTIRYFYDFADPCTGMARERSNNRDGNIITTGGTGFGIMALIAAAERGYVSAEQVHNQMCKIVTFLEKAERFHGAWAHWYNADSGKPFSFSKYDDGGDLVETAFLIQGLLSAREYYKNAGTRGRILANRITNLWETVEWSWYTKRSKNSLYWHWSKNFGWKMNHRIQGFDETMITYVLAASSPTYPIEKSVYDSCYKHSDYYYNGKTYFGIKLDLGMEYGGPLFFTHYSFLGLKPVGLSDGSTDYFIRNRAHALIHRAYAIDNPGKFVGYGACMWGFTSSDDPFKGYTSHHPGTLEDNGTISPTAALASVVYTPKESMDVLRNLYFNYGKRVWGKYGFYDALNPGLPESQQVIKSYLAIDQGPIAVMIENYRSGLLWRLFLSNPEINNGLKILGFKYLQ